MLRLLVNYLFLSDGKDFLLSYKKSTCIDRANNKGRYNYVKFHVIQMLFVCIKIIII